MQRRTFVGGLVSLAAAAGFWPRGASLFRAVDEPTSVEASFALIDPVGGRLEVHRREHRLVYSAGRLGSSWQYTRQGCQPGELNGPTCAVATEQGELWVSNSGNSELLCFDRQGTLQRVVGGYGEGSGRFRRVAGLAISPSGELHAADVFNHRVQVFDAHGQWLRTLGELGAAPGQLNGPVALSFDRRGALHVLSRGHQRVDVFDVDGRVLASHPVERWHEGSVA